MATPKIDYRIAHLQVASAAPLMRLAGMGVKSTLERIAAKATYTAAELASAEGSLERVETSIRSALKSWPDEDRVGYANAYNAFLAAQDVRNVFEDLRTKGRLGFAVGSMDPLALMNDINAQLEAVDALIGGAILREPLFKGKTYLTSLGARDDGPEAQQLFAQQAAHLHALVTARLPSARLNADERALFTTFLHTLEHASSCCEQQNDVVFINPVAKAAASVLASGRVEG